MGRPQFAQVGTKGGGDTIATTNRPEIHEVNASTSGSIASGNNETTEVYAPAGATYNVVNCRLDIGADGNWTSGGHRLFVRTISFGLDSMYLASTYTTDIIFRNGHIATANDGQAPSTEAAQQQQMRALRATENNPIVLSYYNDADVAQDNGRTYRFAVEEATY